MSADMSGYGGGYGSTGYKRTATAFFDNRAQADQAVADLVGAGIPRGDINVVEGGGTTTTASTTSQEPGFWEELKNLFLPEEDRYSYAEGLRRGGYLVSVRVNEDRYDQVLGLLDRDHSVNMEERETSWRSEGWNPYGGTGSSGSAATAAQGLAATGTAAGSERFASGDISQTRALGTNTAERTTSLEGGREEVIPVVEENLQVGKRDVNHGRVRVRSYIVETPVNEQVTLRRERVDVERRPVDRPVTAADEALFRERTIEAVEHDEEAVVSKQARVTEEIALRKQAEQQTETVSDTVRRTEVEVEDERGNALGKTTRTG